jgi:hypothetical protein
MPSELVSFSPLARLAMNSLKFWLIVIVGLPVVAAVCLVFWVGIIGLFEGSDTAVAVTMVILGTGGFVVLRVVGQRLRRLLVKRNSNVAR